MTTAQQSHPRQPLNPVAASMADFRVSGMRIPKPWFQKLLWEPTGQPYLVAILILADIVYWYIPIPNDDEQTNRQIGWMNKFWGHKLEINYATYGQVIGATKRQTQDAISWLVQQGAITRELAPIWGPGGRKSGMRVFVEPVLEHIKFLNLPIPKTIEPDPDRDIPPSHVFGGDGDEEADFAELEGAFLGAGADRLTQNCTPSHPKRGDLTENTESKSSHVFNPPPYPPLGEAADAAGAPAALGAADAAGGGTDGDVSDGDDGDAASAATGAPDGAGDPSPVPAAPPRGPYPESVAWLIDEGCEERPERFAHWPLPILQKRLAGKQRLERPIAGLVASLIKSKAPTAAELDWYEEQLARAEERGTPIDPLEPTRPPAELVGQALNYGWIDQVRTGLVEALAAIGEAPEHFAVTAWPTASRPYACYMIRDEELRLVYRAIESDIRREICRAAGCAGMAIELECVVGSLAGLPALPQARPVAAPAPPSRAVEPDASPLASGRCPDWAHPSAWAVVPLRLQLILQHAKMDPGAAWPRGTVAQQKVIDAEDTAILATRTAICALLRYSGIEPCPPEEQPAANESPMYRQVVLPGKVA